MAVNIYFVFVFLLFVVRNSGFSRQMYNDNCSTKKDNIDSLMSPLSRIAPGEICKMELHCTTFFGKKYCRERCVCRT